MSEWKDHHRKGERLLYVLESRRASREYQRMYISNLRERLELEVRKEHSDELANQEGEASMRIITDVGKRVSLMPKHEMLIEESVQQSRKNKLSA